MFQIKSTTHEIFFHRRTLSVATHFPTKNVRFPFEKNKKPPKDHRFRKAQRNKFLSVYPIPLSARKVISQELGDDSKVFNAATRARIIQSETKVSSRAFAPSRHFNPALTHTDRHPRTHIHKRIYTYAQRGKSRALSSRRQGCRSGRKARQTPLANNAIAPDK